MEFLVQLLKGDFFMLEYVVRYVFSILVGRSGFMRFRRWDGEGIYCILNGVQVVRMEFGMWMLYLVVCMFSEIYKLLFIK